MQTRDQNKYAAGAHALAELTQWGSLYAEQTVANARALGAAFSEQGLAVLGAEAGYTRSHQVIIDAGAAAPSISQRCAAVRILLGHTNIYGERAPDASGIRTSTAYTTRQGMVEGEMREIASLISDVALERAPADQTAHAVSALMSGFPTMQFGL
jgi:glycine hydroxymethyltransferase